MTSSVTTHPSGDVSRIPNRPPNSTEIVVGVDNCQAHLPALALLQRLRFSHPRVTLIHSAAEGLPFAPAFGDSLTIQEEFAQVAVNLGSKALHDAKELLGPDIPCVARLTHGNPAERLIEESEVREADLIVVNAKQNGAAGRSAIGSVSRALVLAGTTSVLIAKGERNLGEPFRAVFATDHSPFANRCLERFLELAPKGIYAIDVVSAWEIDDHEAEVLGKNLAKLGGDANRWIEDAVESRNAVVSRKLAGAGYQTRSIVRRGNPNEVLHDVMTEEAADLLIVGSQGQGAMSRALVGSVSLQQVTGEAYPVLIVRPKFSASTIE